MVFDEGDALQELHIDLEIRVVNDVDPIDPSVEDPEEQKDWTIDYGKFGSKMIQRQNPRNQEISIEYEMSEGW